MSGSTVRDQIVEALAAKPTCGHIVVTSISQSGRCDECTADAVLAVVEPILFLVRHTSNGRCRHCSAVVDPRFSTARRPTREGLAPVEAQPHRMHCRFHVGPLEHRWVRTGINGTFGGVDHDCACGGSFRRGGLAGHGDGSETAEPVCPDADQTWRGPR